MPFPILGNVHGITLRLHVGTEIGSLDVYYEGYIDGNIKVSLLGDSLGSTDGAVLGSD